MSKTWNLNELKNFIILENFFCHMMESDDFNKQISVLADLNKLQLIYGGNFNIYPTLFVAHRTMKKVHEKN